MKIDRARISAYLVELERCRQELQTLVESQRLAPDTLEIKAAKYILVVAAEAISGTLQHLLARTRGIAASGYLDTITRARDEGMLSPQLCERLKPFLEFRNSLVHRYWAVDDGLLIQNIRNGHGDFGTFAEEIREFIASVQDDRS